MSGIELQHQQAIGERWYDGFGEVRVMAIADGWIMARRPGCIPFVTYMTQWYELYQDVPRGAADDGAGTKPAARMP